MIVASWNWSCLNSIMSILIWNIKWHYPSMMGWLLYKSSLCLMTTNWHRLSTWWSWCIKTLICCSYWICWSNFTVDWWIEFVIDCHLWRLSNISNLLRIQWHISFSWSSIRLWIFLTFSYWVISVSSFSNILKFSPITLKIGIELNIVINCSLGFHYIWPFSSLRMLLIIGIKLLLSLVFIYNTICGCHILWIDIIHLQSYNNVDLNK